MKLIIINGLPATGKTTIARPLCEKLNLPLIAKDDIKEFLFEKLGTKDREWSKMLGKSSSKFLYELLETLLANGCSVIIESAFEVAFAKPVIESLAEKYKPDIFEIYCRTEKDIRRKRFVARNESGLRHIGHSDHSNYLTDEEPEPLEKYGPINIGKLIEVDTTLGYIDLDRLVEQLAK